MSPLSKDGSRQLPPQATYLIRTHSRARQTIPLWVLWQRICGQRQNAAAYSKCSHQRKAFCLPVRFFATCFFTSNIYLTTFLFCVRFGCGYASVDKGNWNKHMQHAHRNEMVPRPPPLPPGTFNKMEWKKKHSCYQYFHIMNLAFFKVLKLRLAVPFRYIFKCMEHIQEPIF